MIKLEISRKMGKDNWKIDKYLECIKLEIEARDNFEISPPDNKEHRTSDSIDSQPYTIQTLLNEIKNNKDDKYQSPARNRVPVFCKNDHYSDQCSVITNVES